MSEAETARGGDDRGPQSSASQLRFLLTHSSIYGVGTIFSKAIAFVMLPLYTSYLDPTAYGLLELTEATVGMIGMVAGLGITAAMTRFYFDFASEDDRNSVVSTVFVTTIVVTFLVVSATIACSTVLAKYVYGSAEFHGLLRIGVIAMGLGVMLDVFLTYLRIKRQPIAYLSLSIGNLLLSLALNVYFIVFMGLGVVGILYASVLSKFALAVPSAAYLLARTGVRLRPGVVKDLLRYSLPLIPSDVANVLVSYSDRYFVNHLLSTYATGVYGLAQKLGGVLHSLITSPFILAFLPARFELAKRGDAAYLFGTVYDAYMVVMVTLTLALSVFADPVVRLIAAPEFIDARLYVPAIAASTMLLGMKYHFQFGILYAKKTHYVLYVNLVSLAVQLTGNIVLIRILGLWGAVAAFFLATLVTTSMYLWLAQREFRVQYDFRKNGMLLLLAVLAFASTNLLQIASLLGDIVFRLVVLAVFGAAVAFAGIVRVDRIRSVLATARAEQSVT